MENRKVKEGKKNPQDKYYKASELIRGGIINKDAKQEKCQGKTTGQQQAMGRLLELLDLLQTLYGESKHGSFNR